MKAIMRRRFALALSSVAACTLPSSAIAQTWIVNDKTDALTDVRQREVCTVEGEFRLCFNFRDTGMWATLRSTGSAIFDTELFPAMRIDSNEAISTVDRGTIDLERTLRKQLIPRSWNPTYLIWRAQVPSGSGKWTTTPPRLVREMIAGNSLLVRVYLSGGMQRDLTINLEGFCPAAAKVYAESAPPLICPAP